MAHPIFTREHVDRLLFQGVYHWPFKERAEMRPKAMLRPVGRLQQEAIYKWHRVPLEAVYGPGIRYWHNGRWGGISVVSCRNNFVVNKTMAGK